MNNCKSENDTIPEITPDSPLQIESESNKLYNQDGENLSEEEWILVNPQATREFIDDIKQKILQCVNAPTILNEEQEEDIQHKVIEDEAVDEDKIKGGVLTE